MNPQMSVSQGDLSLQIVGAGQGRWRAPSAGKIREPDERFFCGEKLV
jgi:hypothetical protein